MPWVPWMEGIFKSDVNKGEAATSATARASTLLFSWPWWMEIPSSCGWTWGSWVNFRSSDFQDWWTKGGLFPSQGQRLPRHALANEALLQPHCGLEGDAVFEFHAAAASASCIAVARCFAVERVAVAACFGVECVRGSTGELMHAAV